MAVLAAVGLLAACRGSTRLPDRAPDIQGIVTQVDSTNRPFPRVLVEVNPDAFDNSNKSWVSITNESLLYHRDGSTLQQAAFSDVQPQQQVTVWFSGPVLQSYPSQSGAEVLVIDRR